MLPMQALGRDFNVLLQIIRLDRVTRQPLPGRLGLSICTGALLRPDKGKLLYLGDANCFPTALALLHLQEHS